MARAGEPALESGGGGGSPRPQRWGGRGPAAEGGPAGLHDTVDAEELSSTVAAAAAGNPAAWRLLVGRYGAMVTAVARGCRLGEADVGEVYQVTWLRLVENIDRIEHPERIGGWLATTAKRESLRLVRANGKVSCDHDAMVQRPDTDCDPPDARLLSAEQVEAVRRAYALLPPHCRRLLSVLSADDPPSYKEISRLLAMPIGSIGPTRGRCLEHLRRIMEEIGVREGAATN
jgi:RNA polymerase sigma factor (sigma-70 family)